MNNTQIVELVCIRNCTFLDQNIGFLAKLRGGSKIYISSFCKQKSREKKRKKPRKKGEKERTRRKKKREKKRRKGKVLISKHFLDVLISCLISNLGYCDIIKPKINTRLGKEGKVRKIVRFGTWTFSSFNWIHDL